MQQGLLNANTRLAIESAAAAIPSAAAFFWGCGYILYNLFQNITSIPSVPDAQAWTTSISLAIAGLGYIPLDFYLYRRNSADPSNAAGSRRGFVLALLGGGILALAIGGAAALYAWATALFGSPFTNWQQVAAVGLSAFIVGVILVGFYLWRAITEKLFTGVTSSTVPQQPVQPAPSTTIEGILDELLAGKITRDEAAIRIRSLNAAPVSMHE